MTTVALVLGVIAVLAGLAAFFGLLLLLTGMALQDVEDDR